MKSIEGAARKWQEQKWPRLQERSSLTNDKKEDKFSETRRDAEAKNDAKNPQKG